MLPMLDDYDWREAFGYAGDPEACPQSAPQIDPTPTKPCTPTGEFGREDVTEIIAHSLGENDEEAWLMAGRLKDGRYFFLSAGCDYTGWD